MASSGCTVPGTELTPEHRDDVVRRLTIAGWLLLGGAIGFISFQLERVRGVTTQPFASVWDQRIEVLSFLMLPPNLVVLAPAAFVAAITSWMAGDDREVWLSTLLRLVAATAIVLATIGLVSIVSIIANDDGGPTDFESIFLRLGGLSMAAGLALVCRTADRFHT
jgi:hypothetical protein